MQCQEVSWPTSAAWQKLQAMMCRTDIVQVHKCTKLVPLSRMLWTMVVSIAAYKRADLKYLQALADASEER